MSPAREQPWYETVPLPALLRHARTTYGIAMRDALAAAGYDDVPPNGLYVIGGLALGAGDVPLGRLIKDLRVSKQSAGQLVDALVVRGYVERVADPDDRRRLTVRLTARGEAAAAAQAGARKKIDAELVSRVGPRTVANVRRTLAELIAIGAVGEDDDAE